MSNIRFEIDNVRGNSFYHYKKYVDDRLETDRSGSSARWGLYCNLKTEEEQQAWLDAVSKFNEENGLETPCSKIKEDLKKFKESLTIDEEQFPERQSYLMPALQAAVDAAGGITGICSDDYIDTIMKACGGALPTKENMLKYATEAFENNVSLDMQILMSSLLKLGVSAFVDPLIQSVESIIDTYFGTIDLIYNETARKYASVLQLYRKWSSDILEPDKEKAKEIFFAELKKLGQPVQEMISYFLTIDVFKNLVEILKSIKTIGQNICNSVFTKFKNLKEIINNVEFPQKQQLLSLISSLLFALGGFVGAMFAARCAKEKEIDNAIDALVKAEGVNNEDELYDKVVIKNPQEVREGIAENTVIYRYAVNDENDYSLYKTYSPPVENNNTANTNPSKDPCLCRVSMCETIDDTDTTDWTTWLERPEEIIIEFDIRLNYTISINVDDQISLNDIIGYINGTPIKARDEFVVSEIGNNYIIGKYQSTEYDNLLEFSSDSNEISLKAQALIQKKIEEFSTNEIDEVIDEYKKLAHTKNFIRDYISYYKFPELARYTKEYSAGDVAGISTDKFIELYEKKADKIKEDHGKDLKKSCKKEVLKQYTDRGRMTELKEFLDSKNDKCLNDILYLYDKNPGRMQYCSEGRICDFMLYSHYVEYLYSDKFEYDEENPYIVKLSDKLNYFIGRRTRLELNKDNLDALIESFNDACNDLLAVYWKENDMNYYRKLSELFKYDTYTNTEIIAKGTSTDSISLYKRVENYIRALTKFERKDEYSDIDVFKVSDYNKLLEEQSKEEDRRVNKEQEEFEKKLKKLAYRFVSLRKIELSLNDNNLTTYIDNDAYYRFETMKGIKGNIVYEYTDQRTYLPTEKLYGTKQALDPYLNILKKLTDEEAKELKELTDEAKKYYIENNDKLNSCSALFNFGEYNWPLKSTIYDNNEPVDYYLFSKDFADNCPVPKNLNELKSIEDLAPEETADDLLNMCCAPNTQIGIDNILYWLKYCGIGTLVNCMLPIYWGTGILIPKIPLPIIYIPLVVINVASMIIVVGIGLCGMCPWPMVLFVNPGATKASIIIPITLAVDYITKQVQQIPGKQKPAIEGVLKPLIKSLDDEINDCIQQDEDIKYQQDQIKNAETDYEINHTLDKLVGLDTTSEAGPIEGDISGTLEENSNILDLTKIFSNYEYGSIDDLEKMQEETISELEQNHFSFNEQPTGKTYDDMISSGKIITKYQAKKVPNRLMPRRSATIKYLCIHYTAGTTSAGGSGRNACAYWNLYDKMDSSTGKYKANGCADFVVDDGGMYQYNPDVLKYCTSAVDDSPKGGEKNGGASMKHLIDNRNSISIEICSNLKSGYVYDNTAANSPGWYFTESSIANARTLARAVMDKYNIPKENVYRHFDVSGKSCPGVVGWNPRADNENEWIKFKDSL